MEKKNIGQLLSAALERRRRMLDSDSKHRGAWRLFNGFTEGDPDLVIDLLGRTAVIHDYAKACAGRDDAAAFLQSKLDFLQCILLKRRHSEVTSERNGILLYGEKCDSFIEEQSVRYAVDPVINHDCSFYCDTRNLRRYLLENMRGKQILNTFAYTGSLGVAAAAGGAAGVLQTDLSDKFMNLAYRSASLNGFAFTRKNFCAGDFFPVISRLRREQRKFDCVILDPPFFSSTSRGVIDLANNPLGVINKVRPLVADNGILIVVNNSLYLSGSAFMEQLDSICDGEYLRLAGTIPIPEDFCFKCDGASMPYPADPAPFNHPTKIVLLEVHCQ